MKNKNLISKPKIKLLKEKTFLKMILNSCGSLMWKNNYGLIDNKEIDLVQNGNLSCAFYVSSLLKLFDLISDVHLTVKSTEKELLKNGFKKIPVSKNMPKGTVIIWKKKKELNIYTNKKEDHLHIGFYVGNEKAVSMSSFNGFPIIHHYLYNNTRKIAKAYYKKIV